MELAIVYIIVIMCKVYVVFVARVHLAFVICTLHIVIQTLTPADSLSLYLGGGS